MTRPAVNYRKSPRIVAPRPDSVGDLITWRSAGTVTVCVEDLDDRTRPTYLQLSRDQVAELRDRLTFWLDNPTEGLAYHPALGAEAQA